MTMRPVPMTEHVSLAKSIEERLFDVEIFLKEFARAAAGKERYADLTPKYVPSSNGVFFL
jgi:hypothetical protein